MASFAILLATIFAPPSYGQQAGEPEGIPPEQDSAAPLDPSVVASAYLDAGAADLVSLARLRREQFDHSVFRYRTRVSERSTVGLKAIRRERVLWGREVVADIDWQQDGPIRIDVVGATEVIPVAVADEQVPDGLSRSARSLAFEPSEPYLLTGWGDDEDDLDLVDPLRGGSELHYRFRSGGTRTIRLPDGRAVELAELQIIPRRRSPNLIQGSFWLETETHSVVQVTFRLAEPADFIGDSSAQGLIGSITGELEYITLEYGLWDFRWWLPRLMAVHGVVKVGRFGTLPIRYERTYSDYQIEANPEPLRPLLGPQPGDSVRAIARCPRSMTISVRVGDSDDRATPPDSAARSPAPPEVEADSTRRRMTPAQRRACARFEVTLPDDTASLAHSPALSGEDFGLSRSLLSPADLAALEDRIRDLANVPLPRPEIEIGGPFSDAGLIRYNRVEGLSLGARAEVDLGILDASATVRLGTADLEPNGEFQVGRDGRFGRLDARVYRRLVQMNPDDQPFGLGNSFSALVGGQDDADYFRTVGAEITGEPAIWDSGWFSWRLFAQRETSAEKNTDFSVRHLFDGSRDFEVNEVAQHGDQFGASVRLNRVLGGLRWGLAGEATLTGALGSWEFLAPSATITSRFPLPGRFAGSLQASAGTSFGDPAIQHLWWLGGASTVRGYPSGILSGEAYWRGRAEVANQLPAARLVLFSDAGWAGDADAFELDPALLSAGVGVSFLDGLFRLDVARALRGSSEWRATAYLNGWL